jgi:hypothetical protein
LEDSSLTTGNRTWGTADTTIRVAPLILATLLAASFLAGILVMSLLTTTRGAPNVAIQPAAPFDAVTFRAEEHVAIQPVAPFDAVTFRAEEHALEP